MKDPLYLITVAVSLCLVAIFGRYLVTGTFDKDVAGVLATVLGGLITALTTRRKDPPDDPPAPPPTTGGTPDA